MILLTFRKPEFEGASDSAYIPHLTFFLLTYSKYVFLLLTGSKLRANVFNSVEECQADLVLMFDNAQKYNEPDSQIYKDALVLQNLVSR